MTLAEALKELMYLAEEYVDGELILQDLEPKYVKVLAAVKELGADEERLRPRDEGERLGCLGCNKNPAWLCRECVDLASKRYHRAMARHALEEAAKKAREAGDE